MNEENNKVTRIDSGALESIERAQIDMQIATAKRYPRDIVAVKKGIESMATLDQETAEACFYTLPRGDKTIQGPGVRMAEIAIHQFGNIRVQSRVIDTVIDGPAPHVTVQAVCADLEKNVAVSIEKRRRIVGKRKNNGRIDEDDINLAANACAAIAFRDAAFKVIPGALIKPAYEAAKKVAIGDAKTLAVRRADAFARFAKMGVGQDRVLVVLQKAHLEAVDLADLETLFGIFTSIREGQVSIDEAFPVASAPAKGADALAAKLKSKAKEADTTPPEVPPVPSVGKPETAEKNPQNAEDNIPMETVAERQAVIVDMEKKIAKGPARRARKECGIEESADIHTVTDSTQLNKLIALLQANL